MTAAPRAIPTWMLAVLLACIACAHAAQLRTPSTQAPAQPSSKQNKPAFRSECVGAIGFCVSIPSTWKRVGDIFDNLGFVAAEPHSGADPASWPQLTVVAFEPPPESTSAAGPSPAAESNTALLDVLVDRMLMPTGALASAQTLSRSRTMLNGAPAEIVRVQFPGKTGGAEAVEEVALIEGVDNLVYSVALRCAPHDCERLEPVFQQAVQGWRIRQAAAAPPPKRPAASPPKTPAANSQKPSSTPASPQTAHPKQDSARP
jgi:hypothetical protein